MAVSLTDGFNSSTSYEDEEGMRSHTIDISSIDFDDIYEKRYKKYMQLLAKVCSKLFHFFVNYHQP